MSRYNIPSIINNMTIYVRKDNRLEGRITIDGKRKSFFGRTKSEIRIKAKEYLQKVENGYKEPKKIVLNDYIDYWLKTYKENKIEPSSYTRLYGTYVQHIKNTIGTMYIGDITTKVIQNLIDEYANPQLNGKALSLSGLKKILQLLRPCLEKAIEENIIYKNPCNNVILPKEGLIQKKTKKQYSLTDEEIAKIKTAAFKKYKSRDEYCSRDAFVLLTVLNLGLRAGEVLALNWDDFDIENKIVHIDKTIQSRVLNTKTNKIYNRLKDSTKTPCGVRILSLNEQTIEYLNILKEYDKRNNIKSEYFCCTNEGTRQTSRNLSRSLYRLINKTDINKQVSLHTLRHTFGSTLLRRGVNIAVISKLMGHSNISITYNKYIHSIKEEEAKAMQIISVS